MSKKKLAFYDAFRQKPDDSTDQPSDTVSSDSSTSSKNLSGYAPYTPGEELSIRPRPKHIPTSHHAVGGQSVEVRAKGSSLAPGLAQKYQTPNVNRTYLPNETGSIKVNAVKPSSTASRNMPPMPPTEEVIPTPAPTVEINKRFEPKTQTISKPIVYESERVTVAKPISSQSETMPYLQHEDLETQNINIQSPKKSVATKTSSQPQEEISSEPVFKVSVPQAFAFMFGSFLLIFIAFYIGLSSHSENSSSKTMPKAPVSDKNEQNKDISNLPSDHNKIGTPIPPPVIEVEKTPPTVVIPTKGIIIRACTVESLEKAKLLAQKLESSGIKPTELKQTRKGVLIIVGPFETSSEASSMLKSLKFKSINGWKPFEDAYILNN